MNLGKHFLYAYNLPGSITKHVFIYQIERLRILFRKHKWFACCWQFSLLSCQSIDNQFFIFNYEYRLFLYYVKQTVL
jgi:hypothetical protein